jgi:hypothetical protein
MRAYLIEPHIIAEVRVPIQLRIPAIGGSSAFHITTKNMDNAVLNLLRDTDQVGIVPTACRAFDLDDIMKI